MCSSVGLAGWPNDRAWSRSVVWQAFCRQRRSPFSYFIPPLILAPWATLLLVGLSTRPPHHTPFSTPIPMLSRVGEKDYFCFVDFPVNKLTFKTLIPIMCLKYFIVHNILWRNKNKTDKVCWICMTHLRWCPPLCCRYFVISTSVRIFDHHMVWPHLLIQTFCAHHFLRYTWLILTSQSPVSSLLISIQASWPGQEPIPEANQWQIRLLQPFVQVCLLITVEQFQTKARAVAAAMVVDVDSTLTETGWLKAVEIFPLPTLICSNGYLREDQACRTQWTAFNYPYAIYWQETVIMSVGSEKEILVAIALVVLVSM